jgi:hypothetical protein
MADNPSSLLMNSDFKLAALVTGGILAVRHTTTPHANILLASNNMPAVSWATCGSTTSTETPASLLQYLAQQRRAMPFTFAPCFTPGHTNQVADCCSCFFHLPNMDFLVLMNAHFPIQPCWTLVLPLLLSAVNLMLLKQLQSLES